MYKIYRVDELKCGVEFSFFSKREEKMQLIMKVISLCKKNKPIFYAGEISGLDFNVDRVMKSIKSMVYLVKDESSGIKNVVFLFDRKSDIQAFIKFVDLFTEGRFILYLLSELEYNECVENRYLENLLEYSQLCISVHSDSTYLELQFNSKGLADAISNSLNAIEI